MELSKSGIPITLVGTQGDGTTPSANPRAFPTASLVVSATYHVQLPGDGRHTALLQLMVFIRLWRKLKALCGAEYTFAQLYDICTVLKLFNGTAINPEFIRQLAAFQMLRDQFRLPLRDRTEETPGATGADRTHLLALWVGSGAKKWNWAKQRLLEGVEAHARPQRDRQRRAREEQVAHMADNLDALSRLAGFNPPTAANPSTDVWNSNPGCTLRFAEVLAKMCASEFRIGELLYLFNAAPPPAWRKSLPGAGCGRRPRLSARSAGRRRTSFPLETARRAAAGRSLRRRLARLDVVEDRRRIPQSFRLCASRRAGSAALAGPAFLPLRARRMRFLGERKAEAVSRGAGVDHGVEHAARQPLPVRRERVGVVGPAASRR